MTPREAVLLTRYVKACCPQQAMDEFTPDAWFDLLGDLSMTDCKEAVQSVAMRQPFAAPAEIRAEVRNIRAERLKNSDQVIPDADPDDRRAYIAALRSNYRDLADGVPPARAVGAKDHLAIASGAEVEPVDNEAVASIVAAFDARRNAAMARREAEREAAVKAARAYVDAQEVLLALPDLGEAVITRAEVDLFGPAQAAAGFPLAEATLGSEDRHKTLIYAAQLAEAQAETDAGEAS